MVHLSKAGKHLLVTLLMLTACAAPPPRSWQLHVNPIAEEKRVTIVVDSCIKYDTLTDDYFLIDSSIEIARRTADQVTQFLLNHQIKPTTGPILFACGALHTQGNSPIRAAIRQGASVSPLKQPLSVASILPTMAASPQEMLSTLSTFVQSDALKKTTERNKKSVFSLEPEAVVSQDTFHDAAVSFGVGGEDIAVYIGVNGTIVSSEKSTMIAAGKTVLSLALAVGQAAGPRPSVITPGGQIVKPGGVGFYSIYSPESGLRIAQIVAGLIDLKNGKLTWSNAMEGAKILYPSAIDELFYIF